MKVNGYLSEDELVCNIAGAKRMVRAPAYGERAWATIGKKFRVIIWDAGNGCCSVMQVLPSAPCGEAEKAAIAFYKRYNKEIAKLHGEEIG